MDEEMIWNNVLQAMENEVSRANFLTFFKQTSLISIDDGIAIVSGPSAMSIDMLQKRFSDKIKQLLKEQTQADVELAFIQKSLPHAPLEEKAGPLFNQTPVEKPFVPTLGHLPRVRSEYTFDTFAVSGSNELAYTSATAVANHMGTSYNPLFIYGPVGVGKTHLMHAIANDVYHKDPSRKIIYITSEEFTNEVVDAIRNNDTAKMKRRFRSAFLLLIDDIQFIEGKERVQEELFHTFNILIDNGAQICLSSDRPPHEIKKLEKRLSSRFAGGLTVDIAAPDFELKTAIVLTKAKKFGYEIPNPVAMLLANHATDTRSLEGLLLLLITKARGSNQEITIELAKKIVGEKDEEKPLHLHSEDIIKTICEFYTIKPTQLKGPKRDAALVKARQIAMYLLKSELGLTLVEIGNVLGGRDHTTIMHGVEKIQKLVHNKERITEDIQGITNRLHG